MLLSIICISSPNYVDFRKPYTKKLIVKNLYLDSNKNLKLRLAKLQIKNY